MQLQAWDSGSGSPWPLLLPMLPTQLSLTCTAQHPLEGVDQVLMGMVWGFRAGTGRPRELSQLGRKSLSNIKEIL